MIYLDHASTTAVHPLVQNAMLPCLHEVYGNPSSLHEAGIQAAALLQDARKTIADCISAHSDEIIFTSGGTESNNLVFRVATGACSHKHIIISAFEHPSVLKTAAAYEQAGYRVTRLPVTRDGFVRPDTLRNALTKDTCLVSCMLANNEIGTIQPIRMLARIAHQAGALFHTDAVQAFGVLPINIRELDVDMLSASSHKIYGPKGVGFLFASRRIPDITPLLYGGGQESHHRAGTENIPGIVGFSAAAALAHTEQPKRTRQLRMLRDRLTAGLFSNLKNVAINGSMSNRLPGNLNVRISGINSGTLLGLLDSDGICASSGSACSSSEPEPSHVLTALGLSPEECYGSLRFTLGIDNDARQIDEAVASVTRHVRELLG